MEFKCRETGAGSCRQGGRWAGGMVESSCLERGRWDGAGQMGLAVREALLLPAWPSDLGQATATGAWSWESVSPAARCPEGNYLPPGTYLILLSLSLPMLGHLPILASRCLPPPLMPGEPAVRVGSPHPSLWEQQPPATGQLRWERRLPGLRSSWSSSCPPPRFFPPQGWRLS